MLSIVKMRGPMSFSAKAAVTAFSLLCAARAAILTTNVVLNPVESGAGQGIVISSNAIGIVAVTLDTTAGTLTLRSSMTGVTPTVAHVHGSAGVGSNAGVLITLTTPDISGSYTASAAAQVAILAGKSYINVHSAAYPSGEIRGQILFSGGIAVLTGAQEVPSTLSGTVGVYGIASVVINDTMAATALVTLKVYNVDSTFGAAHIHAGGPGLNGPIVCTLTPSILTSGNLTDVACTIPAAQLTALAIGQMYVNVHSSTFPGGAVRGQILFPSAMTWPSFTAGSTFTPSATLSGANEVPTPVTTSAAGVGLLLTPADPSQVGVYAVFVNAKGPFSGNLTAAHIHGAANSTSNAGVLTALPVPNIAWHVANISANAVGVAAVSSGNAYLNVHTTANPGGEIRGQIAAPVTPSPVPRPSAASPQGSVSIMHVAAVLLAAATALTVRA